MALNLHKGQTICALSSPAGIGAISLIRLSGDEALGIMQKSFKKDLSRASSHTAHFGLFKDGCGETIDEVVVTVYKNPNSFTGEDMIEIGCHGSMYIQQKILNRLIETGSVPAGPGEFTMRAFLNGKMDLSQADAVADLIHATSAASHKVALNHMRGGFSNQLQDLREQLIHFASMIELELDFSEEDVEFANRDDLLELVGQVMQKIAQLLDSFELGNVIKNGVKTTIVGRPNAGKSTLLNALLNEERAIVSDIAGTTRDTIEESMVVDGLMFRFIDTAGIRDTTDEIERKGVQKAVEQVQKSDVFIYLFDVSKTTLDEVAQDLEKLPLQTPFIIVANKSDLLTKQEEQNKLSEAKIDHKKVLCISAQKSSDIETVKSALLTTVNFEQLSSYDTIVTNAKHVDALKQAKESLQKVVEGLHIGIPGDLLAMDIRQSLYHLGTITGEISSEDLLDNIFSKFCIGK